MAFALNLTTTTLSLRNGYVRIAPLGYIPVTDLDVTHPHFEDALLKGWIRVVQEEPVSASSVSPPVIEVHSPYEGLTEAEMLAANAQESAEKQRLAAEMATEQAALIEQAANQLAEVPDEGSLTPEPEVETPVEEPSVETPADETAAPAPKKARKAAQAAE